MPVVFRERGYRFHFFSNEGSPREPVHIHVGKDASDAKLWLYPEVIVAYNDGFDSRTERWLIEVATERRSDIRAAWDEFFSSGN